MARRPPFPNPAALRGRRERRTERLLANRAIAESLISVAGLLGRPVRITGGAEVGRLADLVARWDGELYPPVTGLVVRVARRLAFVPVEQLLDATGSDLTLASATVSLRDFERRPGEVLLAADVLDHQLVDVDGVRVVRASDLYLAEVLGGWRLVGVDVSIHSLLRRLGPARRRSRPTPERVIDWAGIQPFGVETGPLRLRSENQSLARLRPAELADLLEELGRPERHELLAALQTDSAADALEEMEPEELRALLRDLPVPQAAQLLAAMEPDEAADALRDLDDDELQELLPAMPAEVAEHLRELLAYPERTAGGLMTTRLTLAHPEDRVGDVRAQLAETPEDGHDLDAIVLVDDEGRLVDDVRLLDLLLARDDQRLDELASSSTPMTVEPAAPLETVVDRLTDARRPSVLVVDDEQKPVGRILADDIIDALRSPRDRHGLHVHLP